MNKIEKIAKNIVGYISTLNVDNNGIIQQVKIDDVIILLSDEPVEISVARFASRDNKPSYFNLQEVKECIKASRYKFKPRTDGKSNPENIGISEQESLKILSSLSIAEFDRKLPETNEDEKADVYKKFGYVCERTGIKIDLYIKFSVIKAKGGRNVLIISFHEEGDYR